MFKKKETLLQNITFMGIVGAINVLMCVLGAYLPITGIFIIIFLPFFSAAVTLLCKKKYYPIYAFATIGVALVATLWNTEFTLFYLIPSVITGFLFGFCFSKKLNGVYSLLFTSIAQFGLTYLMLPIIKGIYGTDLIYVFLKLFNLLDSQEYIMIIVPSFIYLLSLVEMIFTYIVLTNELNKFKLFTDNEINLPIILIGLGLSILTLIFSFFAVNIAYLIMFISLFITVSILTELITSENKPKILLSIFIFALGFILVFALYQFVKMPYTLLLINTSNILIAPLGLLYNLKRVK